MAVGARLMAEGLPMHQLLRCGVTREPDGTVQLIVDPGVGSGPDATATLRPTARGPLPAPFSECFEDWEALLGYDVPQDRAMSTQPWRRTTTREEIDLGIPLAVCEPLSGTVTSRAVVAIVGDAAPLCFRVPSVAFHFSKEVKDSWDHTG